MFRIMYLTRRIVQYVESTKTWCKGWYPYQCFERAGAVACVETRARKLRPRLIPSVAIASARDGS